jgi:hypothetical protein
MGRVKSKLQGRCPRQLNCPRRGISEWLENGEDSLQMAKVLDRDMAENQNVIQIDENEWKRAAPAREVRKVPCSNNAADSLAADTPLLEVSNAIPEPSGQKHSPPSPHMALSTTST